LPPSLPLIPPRSLHDALPISYRSLSAGDSGPDVAALNANLVHLGYATQAQLDPSSHDFSSATVSALKKLQSKLAEDQTGSLDLGDRKSTRLNSSHQINSYAVF